LGKGLRFILLSLSFVASIEKAEEEEEEEEEEGGVERYDAKKVKRNILRRR